MKVAIVGAAGRMGQMLVKLAEADPGLEVSAKVDVAPGFDATWPAGTEAIIDFTFHAAVPANIEKAASEGAAYVIGTKYFPVVGANIDFAPLYHVISVEPAHDAASVAAIGSDAAIILNGVGCVTARDLTVVMIHLAHDAASVLVIGNVAVFEGAVRDGD